MNEPLIEPARTRQDKLGIPRDPRPVHAGEVNAYIDLLEDERARLRAQYVEIRRAWGEFKGAHSSDVALVSRMRLDCLTDMVGTTTVPYAQEPLR